ncbi:MAG: Uma2 family endonuclease [Bryobacteraceae bacterium]
MPVATAPLSLEEFHRLYDDVKPYYEYWFGEAVQKPMATSLHGAVQFVLMLLLRTRGWKALPEVTLKLVPHAEPVPDIIASRKTIEQPYPTNPVDICVEIRSPQDPLTKLFKKGKYYLAWGVDNVWIVDPEARTAWMMTREHPDGIWVHPDGSLKAKDTEILLPELFAEVDAMVSKRES